jgi:transcriptional regulator with XRE-family HTH domain
MGTDGTGPMGTSGAEGQEGFVASYYRAIARNICALMVEREVSPRAAASHLGVDERTVKKWRSGERVPRLGHIIRLAALLDVSPGSILDGRTT